MKKNKNKKDFYLSQLLLQNCKSPSSYIASTRLINEYLIHVPINKLEMEFQIINNLGTTIKSTNNSSMERFLALFVFLLEIKRY